MAVHTARLPRPFCRLNIVFQPCREVGLLILIPASSALHILHQDLDLAKSLDDPRYAQIDVDGAELAQQAEVVSWPRSTLRIVSASEHPHVVFSLLLQDQDKQHND